MDRLAGGEESTWRHEHDLAGRLGRERRRDRRARRSYRGTVLLPDILPPRLLRQVTIATIVLVLTVAATKLPYGLGARFQSYLAGILATDTDVEQAAVTLRQLAEEGRQWAMNEFDAGTLPVVGLNRPDTPSEEGPTYWVWPVEGEVRASFGWQQVAGRADEYEFNPGLDITAEEGALVIAAASGRVRLIEEGKEGQAEGGTVVHIDHGGGWETRYGNLRAVYVEEGDRVQQGDVIGEVGAPANGQPPQLHFEMLFGGKQVDPEPKLRRDKGES